MPSINSGERNPQDESQNRDYPLIGSHREKIFIVVKTSPNPSDKYRETVCTAGITEGGRWIRLYPIPFRYMEFDKRFRKYQRLEVEIKKRPFDKDFRIDSYEPNCQTIKLVGEPLPAGKWTERKKMVLPTISPNLEAILEQYKSQAVSLGIFKPKRIVDFLIEPDDSDWSSRRRQTLTQGVLFGQQPKILEKIPYKFSYKFICDNFRCRGHKMQIIDWEINELYRNTKSKHPFSMDIVLEKIKQMWFHKMWAGDRDSYLIVGSVYPHPVFVVIGVFWPPREGQLSLIG